MVVEYNIASPMATRCRSSAEVGRVGRAIVGTRAKFWPDPVILSTAEIQRTRARHLLRAKAVLCPGLIRFAKARRNTTKVLPGGLGATTWWTRWRVAFAAREEPFVGSSSGNDEVADWALVYFRLRGEAVTESYVNLIPTPQGGHVNGAAG